MRWPYRESRTRRWTHADLEPFEFLRRFLQHVLPAGFHRVRRFGWLHPGGRRAFNRVRALLGQPPHLTQAEQVAWFDHADLEPPDPSPPQPSTANPQPLRCPRCQHPMLCLGTWRAGQRPLSLPERARPP